MEPYINPVKKHLPPPQPLEQLSYQFVREDELNELGNIVSRKKVKVFVTNPRPIQTQNPYYKWEVWGEYEFRETAALSDIFVVTGAGPEPLTCFLRDSLRDGEIQILDASGLTGNESFTQQVKSIPVDYRFAFNYCVHVEQLSLTEGAYRFWDEVKKSTLRNGLFLESAPGTATGNLYNPQNLDEQVLGYFFYDFFDDQAHVCFS